MSKKHFNSLPNFSASNVNVDRENDILKGVEIAKFGKNKNGTYFNMKFLNDLVAKGNEQKQGVKSRFGHPNMCAESLGTFVGRYKNFRLENEKVYADLHIDQITKKTQVEGKGITMYDYIMDMAENNPDMFGNSIVVSCQFFEEEIENESGKKERVESLILDQIVSSDLVDDPAATDALFSNNPNDLGVLITDFLDQNPQVFQTIVKKPEIIEDFFSRYVNYVNRKSLINLNMSIFEKFKKKFSSKKEEETFDIDVTLADGSIVTVVTEAEEPQVGDQVQDAEGNPVADATHILPDGGSITTVDGVITEISGSEEEEEEETEPSLSEVLNSVNKLSKAFDTFQKNVNKTNKDFEKTFDLITEEHQKLSKKVDNLAKKTKSNYDVPPGTPQKKKEENSSGYDPEKAKEIRNKRNQ